MNEPKGTSGPQFRADRPAEQEAVRTTIVGGRPPGSGQSVGAIPRGIEVLVKKASVDDDFKTLLLRKRARAAEAIGLKLDPSEAMMLAAVPRSQLETIIAQTSVPREHRRVFLGRAAVAMLAAIGVTTAGCLPADYPPVTDGIRPDDIPSPTGERPDIPPDAETPIERPEDVSVTTGTRPPGPPPRPTETHPEAISPSEGPTAEELNPPEYDPYEVTRGIRPDRVPITKGTRPRN